MNRCSVFVFPLASVLPVMVVVVFLTSDRLCEWVLCRTARIVPLFRFCPGMPMTCLNVRLLAGSIVSWKQVTVLWTLRCLQNCGLLTM